MVDRTPPSSVDTLQNKPKVQTEFKIADIREDDVTLEMDDGRVFIATLDEKIDPKDLRRGTLVGITSDGMDTSDAPKAAVVNRIIPRDKD